MSADEVYDCIVIGAGYAGLLAARTLFRAGKNVIVLEARDRVGGRSYTQNFDDGSHVDNGSAFLGPTQTRMLELAKEYGVELFSTHCEGRLIQYYRNKRKTYKGVIPALRLWELLDADNVIKSFEKAAATMNLEEPWKSPNAAMWDGLTYDMWLHQKCKTKASRDEMAIVSGVLWGAEPSELSMLHALWFSKSGENLTHLATTIRGAQETMFKAGSTSTAWKVQEELGSTVRLQQPVEKIVQDGAIVTVQTYTDTFKARKVICTVPIPLTRNIHFSPPLPLTKRQVIEQHHMGALWKVHAHYEKPFWRGKYTGEVTSPNTFLTVCFDVGAPDTPYGALLGFVSGYKAKLWAMMTEEERKKTAIKEFVIYYGEEARNPYRYHEYTMTSDEWATGCPAAVPRPGMWTTVGRHMHEPFNHVHFAGSEYSTTWSGYMEGAVRSGEKSAGAVLQELKAVAAQ